jgi:hypothetical protein
MVYCGKCDENSTNSLTSAGFGTDSARQSRQWDRCLVVQNIDIVVISRRSFTVVWISCLGDLRDEAIQWFIASVYTSVCWLAPWFDEIMQREGLRSEYRIEKQGGFDVLIVFVFDKRFDCGALDHIPRRAGIFNFLSI